MREEHLPARRRRGNRARYPNPRRPHNPQPPGRPVCADNGRVIEFRSIDGRTSPMQRATRFRWAAQPFASDTNTMGRCGGPHGTLDQGLREGRCWNEGRDVVGRSSKNPVAEHVALSARPMMIGPLGRFPAADTARISARMTRSRGCLLHIRSRQSLQGMTSASTGRLPRHSPARAGDSGPLLRRSCRAVRDDSFAPVEPPCWYVDLA